MLCKLLTFVHFHQKNILSYIKVDFIVCAVVERALPGDVRLVAQRCSILYDSMDCKPPGFSVHGILQQEYGSGLPFPSPEDLPDTGIKPRSPALQADSLVVKNLPAKARDVGDLRDEGSLLGFLGIP